jgi:predicted nucleotidyltransferase
MTRARACRDRAIEWASGDARVAAAVLYGSVASRRDHEFSDLDLVIVAHAGNREELWHTRGQIAQRLLGEHVAWAHEVAWQRHFRYQAWPATFDVMVDLTFDERQPELWRGTADTFEVLVDREGVETRLRADLARWQPPSVDAELIDASAWPWLAYLDSNWRSGKYWAVRASLHDFLNDRVMPLLTGRSDATERDLSQQDLQTIHEAAPSSGDADELRRAMRAATALYVSAIEEWATRAGEIMTPHPMAAAILERLAS